MIYRQFYDKSTSYSCTYTLNNSYYDFFIDLERLRSQAALAAFLSELGEAVEQAELVYICGKLDYVCALNVVSMSITKGCYAKASACYAVYGCG